MASHIPVARKINPPALRYLQPISIKLPSSNDDLSINLLTYLTNAISLPSSREKEIEVEGKTLHTSRDAEYCDSIYTAIRPYSHVRNLGICQFRTGSTAVLVPWGFFFFGGELERIEHG